MAWKLGSISGELQPPSQQGSNSLLQLLEESGRDWVDLEVEVFMGKCQGYTFGWIEEGSKVFFCSFNALDSVLICHIGVNDGKVICKSFVFVFKSLDILGPLVLVAFLG